MSVTTQILENRNDNKLAKQNTIYFEDLIPNSVKIVYINIIEKYSAAVASCCTTRKCLIKIQRRRQILATGCDEHPPLNSFSTFVTLVTQTIFIALTALRWHHQKCCNCWGEVAWLCNGFLRVKTGAWC